MSNHQRGSVIMHLYLFMIIKEGQRPAIQLLTLICRLIRFLKIIKGGSGKEATSQYYISRNKALVVKEFTVSSLIRFPSDFLPFEDGLGGRGEHDTVPFEVYVLGSRTPPPPSIDSFFTLKFIIRGKVVGRVHHVVFYVIAAPLVAFIGLKEELFDFLTNWNLGLALVKMYHKTSIKHQWAFAAKFLQ